jgi:hypothetical protein
MPRRRDADAVRVVHRTARVGLRAAAAAALGIIHPYAVAGPDGQALLVSGRAIRAEHRQHLADTKARRRAVAARAPTPGQRGSRRWRKTRRRARLVEGPAAPTRTATEGQLAGGGPPHPSVGSRSPAPAARIHNTTTKPGER